MINSYCRICGLYLSVPDNYAGGCGACPRCKMALRIPTPIPQDSPYFVEGLRYIAEPTSVTVSPGTVSAIVTEDLGPSVKYDCVKCKGVYESLQAPDWPQGQCPSCETVNDNTVGHVVSFPRQHASSGQKRPTESEIQAASTPGYVLWDMQGEFLVAKPAESQSPSDSIIEPLPLGPNGNSKIAATPHTPVKPQPVKVAPKPVVAKVEKTKETEADKTPPKPTPNISKNKWFYLLRGKETGPIPTEELKELVRTGKASSTVFVWQNGMDSWMPIKEIEELNVEPPHETEGSFSHSLQSLTQRTGKLAQNATNLIWMSMAAVCLVILLFVMRESFMDFGLVVMQATSALLCLGMLVCIIVGIVVPLQDPRLFLRGSTSMQIKWLSGMGGMFVCIIFAGMIGWQAGRKPSIPKPEYSIKLAKQISNTLIFENLSNSFNLIDWEHLIVNGEKFGEKYSNTPLMEKKLLLLEDVYEVFLNAFDPPYDRKYMLANSLQNWHIKVQTVDKTVVSAFSPTSGAEILFTLEGDRLFGLSVRLPKDKYLSKKAEKEPQETQNQQEEDEK